MLKLNEELQDKISYIIIGAILLTALVPLFISVDSTIAFSMRILFISCLAGFYAAVADDKNLFFVTLAVFSIQALLQLILPLHSEVYYKVFLAIPFIIAAIAFAMLTYKHSIEFKAFEMLEGLVAVFLLIYASKFFIHTEFDIYYAFCLSFIIATLMYNNNMWMRYKDSEKNLLIFLLVLAFVDVIQVSGKFISI